MMSPDSKNRFITLGGVVVLLAIALCASWLNQWSLYAFPLGTLITALGIPIAMIALIYHFNSTADAQIETDDIV